MYTVIWTTRKGRERWERCYDRSEVIALLDREGLWKSSGVMIFSPEADDYVCETFDFED